MNKTPFSYLQLLLVTLLSVGLAQISCSKGEMPPGEPLNFPESAETGSTQELHFTVPQGWIEESPSSSMRKTQFRLPGESGDAEVAVFLGIGGTAQENIDRWIAQFSNPQGGSVRDSAQITQNQINNLKVTELDVSGSFSGAMMAPAAGTETSALPNYRLLGAVIEAGGENWFVKLTGPEATVERWQDSFSEYLNSVHGH